MTDLYLSSLSWLEEGRHRQVALLGVLVLAFVLRLTVALVLPGDYRYYADAVEYVSDAENLLAYGVYGEEAGIAYAVVPPGYPLFVAGVLALTGHSMLAVRLAQVILSVATVWLTYLAGRWAFSANAGLGAALICAVYPPFIVYVAPYLSEALYFPLLAFYITYLIRSVKEPTVKHGALAGVGFGLSMLTKETLIAFPFALPLLFWWARFTLREALRYLLVFTVVVVLVLSPWLARNYSVFGHVFYTERTAAIRYQLTGTGYLSPNFEEQVEERKSPVDESHRLYDYYRRYGRTSDLWRVGFLLKNPGTYARYVFNRLVEFWLHPNGLESLPENLLARTGYVAGHVAMLGLALGQMILKLRKRDGATGGLAIILLYVTMVGMFLRRPNPRYNLPFLPILFIFAATGALALIERFILKTSTSQQRGIIRDEQAKDTAE